jgi:hypothetical protein
MTGRRLNGRQRTGIVLSVVWAVVGGYWGMKVGVYDPISAESDSCDRLRMKQTYSEMLACDQQLNEKIVTTYNNRWYVAEISGLLPIPFAWIIAYALIGLVRWIRRGFSPS